MANLFLQSAFHITESLQSDEYIVLFFGFGLLILPMAESVILKAKKVILMNNRFTIQGFSGPLSQKSDENWRMRAFWREF